MAIEPPVSTTNSIGRRGMYRSDTRPPAISPSASDAEIAPHAAGPPRCALATTGPRTRNAPLNAIITRQNCRLVAHSQVWSGTPPTLREARRADRDDRPPARPGAPLPLMASISGTVPNMPIAHSVSASPGPATATTAPATAAPVICPMFITSRLIELPSWSSVSGTIWGSSA